MTPGWNDAAFQVDRKTPWLGVAADGTRYLLEYHAEGMFAAGVPVCNLLREDGAVCRMPPNHDGLHVAFDPLLVSESGVYITDVERP